MWKVVKCPMKTVTEYCQKFEFGGFFEDPKQAAAGRLLGELVDMAKAMDTKGGVRLVNTVLTNDLHMAGLMLGIASGVIAHNEMEAANDKSDA